MQAVKGNTGADTIKAREDKPGYGHWSIHSKAEQDIKKAMKAQPGWQELNDSQVSALEMIAHKIARILNNAPDHLDSWHDIQGYARLAEKEIQDRESINTDSNC